MSTDLIVVTIGSRKLLGDEICVPSFIPLVIRLVEGLVVTLMEGLVVGQCHLIPLLNECFHHIHIMLDSQCHNYGFWNWLCIKAKIGFKCLIHIHIQEKNCITHMYPSIEVHVTITCHSFRITPQCFLNLFNDCFELWIVACVDVHFGILGI
jgi:hypothetical protein